jgi:hypothetical protein
MKKKPSEEKERAIVEVAGRLPPEDRLLWLVCRAELDPVRRRLLQEAVNGLAAVRYWLVAGYVILRFDRPPSSNPSPSSATEQTSRVMVAIGFVVWLLHAAWFADLTSEQVYPVWMRSPATNSISACSQSLLPH